MSSVFTVLSQPEKNQWNTEYEYEGELSTMHKNEKTFFYDDSYLISKTARSDF